MGGPEVPVKDQLCWGSLTGQTCNTPRMQGLSKSTMMRPRCHGWCEEGRRSVEPWGQGAGLNNSELTTRLRVERAAVNPMVKSLVNRTLCLHLPDDNIAALCWHPKGTVPQEYRGRVKIWGFNRLSDSFSYNPPVFRLCGILSYKMGRCSVSPLSA